MKYCSHGLTSILMKGSESRKADPWLSDGDLEAFSPDFEVQVIISEMNLHISSLWPCAMLARFATFSPRLLTSRNWSPAVLRAPLFIIGRSLSQSSPLSGATMVQHWGNTAQRDRVIKGPLLKCIVETNARFFAIDHLPKFEIFPVLIPEKLPHLYQFQRKHGWFRELENMR